MPIIKKKGNMPKDTLPKKFIDSAKKCGLDMALIKQTGIPHFYLESNKILSARKTAGLEFQARSFKEGVRIKLIVKKGAKIKKPVFFCFGILKNQGKQIILPEIILEEGAKVKILAHCTFPVAKKIIHQMEAIVKLKKNSKLIYKEKHYHGENFGAEVMSNFKILLEKESSFNNEFVLDRGSVGKLKINLEMELGKNAVAEIANKIATKSAPDKVEIFDKVLLKGENSRGLIKSRVAAINGGRVFLQGETIAMARGARGHIDCREIIVGKKSTAKAIPIIEVRHPEARVTHEASVGKINQRELETLMTRGLSEEEATDFIIKGVIK